jgi:hypothetical protein
LSAARRFSSSGSFALQVGSNNASEAAAWAAGRRWQAREGADSRFGVEVVFAHGFWLGRRLRSHRAARLGPEDEGLRRMGV